MWPTTRPALLTKLDSSPLQKRNLEDQVATSHHYQMHRQIARFGRKGPKERPPRK